MLASRSSVSHQNGLTKIHDTCPYSHVNGICQVAELSLAVFAKQRMSTNKIFPSAQMLLTLRVSCLGLSCCLLAGGAMPYHIFRERSQLYYSTWQG